VDGTYEALIGGDMKCKKNFGGRVSWKAVTWNIRKEMHCMDGRWLNWL
jgi:hypothetical protein